MLPIRIVKSNVSSVGLSSERNMISHDFMFLSYEGPTRETRNVKLYYPYRQYTDIFISQFVSEH